MLNMNNNYSKSSKLICLSCFFSAGRSHESFLFESVLFSFLYSQLISAEKARDEAQGELAKYTEVTITS